ncbi:MAG: protein kinase [Acidobacteria bacterium]|nr:protein kinase [Acidobacteriota bacterium]
MAGEKTIEQSKGGTEQVVRAKTPWSGSSAWSRITGYGMLPPDIVDKAIRRLGWLALFYAIAFPALRLTEGAGKPWSEIFPYPYPLVDVALAGALLSGGLICALAWSRKICPAVMLDIGLIFEVVGAFWIALAEYGGPPLGDIPFRGFSGICVWIIFFVLVIPETLGKTLLASLTTALMGPVGMLVAIQFYGRPMPEAPEWLTLFFPSFLFAVFAIVLSRFIYSMGLEMRQAREMGSYRLVEKIGAGGMGEVWRAEHRMLARPSAIKLVRSDVCNARDAQTGTLHRRFEREVQATAALRSPHTVAVYDFGSTDEGCFYYVMELLNGFDLETLVQRFGPQPPERVVHFLLQACESLAEAHSNGLIHRDIKPKNVFVCRLGLTYDFIKVLDFGLVKSSSTPDMSQEQLTMEGTTTGTPAYMPPEMALGKSSVDARSDLYSLGCVAYWLLTGKLVFEGNGPVPVLLAHIRDIPVPPSQRTELEIPDDLERVILACLEKDPDRRPQSAMELAGLLASCSLMESWGQQRAATWWRTHQPSLAVQPAAAPQPAGGI